VYIKHLQHQKLEWRAFGSERTPGRNEISTYFDVYRSLGAEHFKKLFIPWLAKLVRIVESYVSRATMFRQCAFRIEKVGLMKGVSFNAAGDNLFLAKFQRVREDVAQRDKLWNSLRLSCLPGRAADSKQRDSQSDRQSDFTHKTTPTSVVCCKNYVQASTNQVRSDALLG
jgi:hypothetical protein